MEPTGLEHADTEAEREAIADAVAAFTAGARPHVAVVGAPFAGRAALLDHAASLLGDDAVRLDIAGLVDTPVELPAAPAVVADDCQYLYTRAIDGFEPLAAFADALVDGDRLFVTGWNRHAWDYLAAVRDLDELFATVVEVPPYSTDAIEMLLTETHDGPLPSFEADEDTPAPDAESDDAFALPGGLPVGLPRVSLADLGDEFGDDTPAERRARVFETITAQSDGNPGVARALWERSIHEGTLTPSLVRATVPDVTLSDDEAFTLAVVLANEVIDRERLRAVVGDRRYRRSLRRLRHQELVTATDETVSIRPAAVPSATAFLERRRLLW